MFTEMLPIRTAVNSMLPVCVALCLLLPLLQGAPPTKRPPEFGPCVGMDCLHGVLMHNDQESGDNHNNEDKFNKLQEKDKLSLDKESTGPCKGMDCLHGVLMHGDGEQGVEHMEHKGPIGPTDDRTNVDPEQAMHGGHGKHHGDTQKKTKSEHEGKVSETFNAEEILHGKHVDHNAEKPKSEHEGKVSETFNAEVLLHGEHVDHNAEKAPVESAGKVSEATSPEMMLHGDSQHGVDHHAEKKEEPESGRAAATVKDPHHFLHSSHDGDSKEDVHLGSASDSDKKDYENWKQGKEGTGSFLGFSFPFISDSLLDNIEQLKRRYLSKFWGSNDDTDETSGSDKERDISKFNVERDPESKGKDSKSAHVDENVKDDQTTVGNTATLEDQPHHHQDAAKDKEDETSNNTHDEA